MNPNRDPFDDLLASASVPRPWANPEEDDDDNDDGDDNDNDNDPDDDMSDKDDKTEKGDTLQKLMLKTRTILVYGTVSDKMYSKVVGQLTLLEAQDPAAPIYVYVNSPGGSADTGFAIYDAMRFSRAPVISVVNGICASAAIIIFLGAEKGRRYSLPNSRFLIHQPSTYMQGTASDLDITAKEILKTRERYNKIVADATGRTVAQITKDADRDFWMSPAEAVDYKLVDRIVSKKSEIM